MKFMTGRAVFAMKQSNRNAGLMLTKSSFFTIKVVIKLPSMYRTRPFNVSLLFIAPEEITFRLRILILLFAMS